MDRFQYRLELHRPMYLESIAHRTTYLQYDSNPVHRSQLAVSSVDLPWFACIHPVTLCTRVESIVSGVCVDRAIRQFVVPWHLQVFDPLSLSRGRSTMVQCKQLGKAAEHYPPSRRSRASLNSKTLDKVGSQSIHQRSPNVKPEIFHQRTLKLEPWHQSP